MSATAVSVNGERLTELVPDAELAAYRRATHRQGRAIVSSVQARQGYYVTTAPDKR